MRRTASRNYDVWLRCRVDQHAREERAWLSTLFPGPACFVFKNSDRSCVDALFGIDRPARHKG